MNYVCSCGEKYLSDQGRIDCEKSHARRTTSQIAAVFKHEAEQLQGLLEIANAGTASHIATIKALEYKLEAALDERRAQAAVIKDLEASNTDLIIEVNEAKGRLDKLTSEQALLAECERLEARLDAANAVADAQARRLTEQLEADYAQRIAAESRLDAALGMLREIEFFLRGHPGEASVLRAKVRVILDGVVERQTPNSETRSAKCLKCGEAYSGHGCPVCGSRECVVL